MQTFIFKSKDGVWDFGNESNYKRFLNYLKENNGREFRIEPLVRTRSLSQNNLYWMYLDLIERETGNNANDLHEYLRRALLSPKRLKVMGKDINIPQSTTDLTKTEFGDYIEKICALTGVPIPDTESYLQEIDLAPLK